MHFEYCEITQNEERQLVDAYESVYVASAKMNPTQLLQEETKLKFLLPARLTNATKDFTNGLSDGLIVNGLTYREDMATPLTHKDREDQPITFLEFILSLLFLNISTPIGYTSQQSGRLINDIIPLLNQSNPPNSSGGFDAEFKLHTEDAFFPFPPDFIGWACHRNNEDAGTLLSSLRSVDLNDKDWDILRTPNFRILPNALQIGARSEHLNSIVKGPKSNPTMTVNFNYPASITATDQEHAVSLQRLEQALYAASVKYIFKSSELLILDNLRVAHGRLPYSPIKGGSGRWLSRMVGLTDIERIAEMTVPGTRNIVKIN